MLAPITMLMASISKARSSALESGAPGFGVERLLVASLQDRRTRRRRAAHEIGLANADGSRVGDRLQQSIADRMAERIVHRLEAVEVEASTETAPVRREAREGRLHVLVEQHAVRQIGQRVMMRHVGDAGLGPAPLGNVLIGRDPAAVGHRLMRHREGAAVRQILEIGAARCRGSAPAVRRGACRALSRHESVGAARTGRGTASRLHHVGLQARRGR